MQLAKFDHILYMLDTYAMFFHYHIDTHNFGVDQYFFLAKVSINLLKTIAGVSGVVFPSPNVSFRGRFECDVC
jgi:hypothetical protein